MGFQDFISEPEAISLTGMSKTTLSRFAEAGYLQLEVDSDGLRLFSKGELAALFGLREVSGKTRPAAAPAKESVKPKAAEAAKVDSTTSTQAPVPSQTTPLESQIEQVAEPSRSENSFIDAPPAAPIAAAPASSEQALEIQRLKNILQLQEKILDLKDQQLKDLKEQRDWLQARVEKLEDKADRDQILLLTETQTIRTLVNLNKQQARRSPVRLALEWLGVASPTTEETTRTSNDTIDVSSPTERQARS